MSKVWFVTGGSRGLGRAIVEVALEAGDRVVATARDTARFGDLVTRYGERVLPVQLDVARNDEVVRAVRQGLERFGRLDVVVNNAGYADMASVEDVTLEDFRAQIDTDFYGVVHVTKAVLPALREQGSGHIIQVSSVGARVTTPGLAAYQSAKWAVSGFSTVLAQEVAPLGIKVTALEPGGMNTDWAGSSMTVPPVSEPYRQTVGAFLDMLRSGEAASQLPSSEPRRVAEIVRDLAGREDAPVRLLLGVDAAHVAESNARDLAASDAHWHDVTVSAAR
ncbi:SDR family NAD(P)-dependent oxidoreductase [Streptomyces sp. NRRL S-340]|uniref:SDR family NAD(P)-dependent oxidoreductase n=1 Tax=Streptomyces sp. NRRL S-340 TaxID=1463901 RepID=UPI00055B521F|nr:SDR family NAD(P)-dependent oxidoreductase [Streptomyces sp. NRRL S-340]